MTEDGLSHNRIAYLDFLRGVSILYIIAVRHLDDYAGQFYNSLLDDALTYSFLGTFVFISGYLLSINNEIKNTDDIIKFLRKRFIRIYPLYFLALLLFSAISLLSFRRLIQHVFLINMVSGSSVRTLWFVSMIFVFYLLYPVIMYRYSIIKSFAILAAITATIMLGRLWYDLFDYRMIVYLPLFLMGIAAHKNQLIKRFKEVYVLMLSAAVFSFSIYLYDNIGDKTPILISLMMSSVPICLAIGKVVSKIIEERFYAPIAYASFCIYLFHRVFYQVLVSVYKPSEPVYILLYLSLIGVPLVITASFHIQKHYDMLVARKESKSIDMGSPDVVR